MGKNLELYFDEKEQVWKEHKEPYCTVEFPEKEDYDAFLKMMEIWKGRERIAEAKNIVTALADMDFCHNFQLSDPWVVTFIHEISAIQKKAKNWREAEDGKKEEG